MKLSQGGVKVMELVTDDNGAFTFKPLAPGTYDLTVNAFGYDTAVFAGLLVSDRGLNFQVLEIAAGVEIPPITILSPLVDKENPEVGITLKRKDLKHMALDGPIDAARTAPMVHQNEKSGGLSIGGSREDATLYVVDGVRVIGSLYVPMNAIQEINVITGGIPASYGDVTGGIVEITTRGFTGAF
jgi:hypothetical protein